MKNAGWLSDIVLISESEDENIAGDVSIFRSFGEACRYLEHWWVEESHGFAITAMGERLILGVENRAVIVVSREAKPRPELVLECWKPTADALLEARESKAIKGKAILSGFEVARLLPNSTEGLIAYIGFTD